MKTVSQSIATLLLGAFSIVPLGAQLTLSVEDVEDASSLGETLILDSEGVGRRVAKRLRLTFDPPADRTISLRTVRIRGSSEFSYDLETSKLPILIRNTITYEMLILFLPTGPGPFRATLELTVRQTDFEDEPEELVYNIQLLGRVPAYSLSYVLPGATQRGVAPGGVLDFGHRPVARATAATLILSNTGSGPGTLRSVRIDGGSPFAIASPPTLPAKLQPGQDLSFELAFEPTRTAAYQGELRLEFGVGLQQFVLAGVGGDLLRYRLVSYQDASTVGPTRDVQSGDVVVFGGQDATIEIVARNIRQSVQRIDAIRLTGDFRIVESPNFPYNVEPGESFSVRIAPVAGALGELSGELLIGDAFFPLRADVPELPGVLFSEAGGVVGPAEQVPLGLSLARPYPSDIAGTLQFDFEPQELGSDPGAQWAGGGPRTSFRIPAGETAAVFASGAAMTDFQTARAVGEITVTARFTIELWAIDITPDPAPELRFRVEIVDLPEVRFSEAGGVVSSAEQIPLEVGLEQPYPTDIVGVLLLVFETRAFTNDPAIQWATGGRQAVFEIPAGETKAVFAGNASTNTFQTGTVAGGITVTAQFFVDTRTGSSAAPGGQGNADGQSGGVDITPDTEPELRFEVLEAAPVLQRAALGSTGQGRFSVAITGYATSRTVDSLSFSFSGVSGSHLTTPSLEADVGSSFSTYYGGNQSAAFGSQFTATVEFTLDEGAFEDLSSLSVSAANGLGASNSVSLQLN